MEEKSIWIILFASMSALCVVLMVFLIMNAGGVESKKKYKELNQNCSELRVKHSKLLQKALALKKSLDQPAPELKQNGSPAEKLKQLEQAAEEQKKTWQGLANDLFSDYDGDNAVMKEIVTLEIQAAESESKDK